MSEGPFQMENPSGLTDADWAELNKLKKAYDDGGQRGLNEAMENLAKHPLRYATVIGALYPNMLREALRDSTAEQGITDEDLREMARKLESPARDQ
jgi:hypothetical protein